MPGCCQVDGVGQGGPLSPPGKAQDEDVDIAINRTTIDPATTTTITMEAEEVDVREIDSEPKH